jgi:hypothetical protein
MGSNISESIGYFIEFEPGEETEILAALEEEGYPKGPQGIKELLLNFARGELSAPQSHGRSPVGAAIQTYLRTHPEEAEQIAGLTNAVIANMVSGISGVIKKARGAGPGPR